mgnify:CR=1 FL=1
MRLKQFFSGVAAKRLSAVEADQSVSHQHEFNGINRFRSMLGNSKQTFRTVFLYLDDDHDPVRATGLTTWYDARENQPSRSAEYRLYFPSTEVSEKFAPGDLLIVARQTSGELLIVAAPDSSSIGDQLQWLFGLESLTGEYVVREGDAIDRDVDYVVRWVLESIGIESPVPEADADLLVRQFGTTMPSTRVFSIFARERSPDCDPMVDPDHSIMVWLETEERYFRAFERMLVEARLRAGFVDGGEVVDVDGFIQFSLSVQNRRKSRAGHALENHLEHVFVSRHIRCIRGATTEGKSKPDFLFPGREQYHNQAFPTGQLTVLGAKATCKDRWRQVLGEADRLRTKHLVTLEPSISTSQTDEMRSREVQLVLPKQIHKTYTSSQREWLWSVSDFTAHVERLQSQ